MILETLLNGSRLEGWQVAGCNVVLDSQFYRFTVIYTLSPKSRRATVVETSVRIPLTEPEFKKITKWLDSKIGKIIQPKKGTKCRTNRAVQKRRK